MPSQSNNSEKILIASSSLDRTSWEPVANELSRRHKDVLVFESDKVATGDTEFEIIVQDSGELEINFDRESINLNDITPAWRRRPNMFAPEAIDWSKKLRLDEERKNMLNIVWSNIRDERWLNSPDAMRAAENKLGQLILAKEVGFNIPKTMVTNRWNNIEEKLPHTIVLKMDSGVLYSEDNIFVMYSTIFENDSLNLPTSSNPFPGYWQPFLTKKREWRITVVGDETFDASIYMIGEKIVNFRTR